MNQEQTLPIKGKVKTTVNEKINYGLGNMGSYIMWSFTAAYITVYVTYCLGFSKENLATFGTFILVCRFFDGLSDIIMGLIIEKTHSKLGKARFWFGVSIIPLTVIFFFIFFVSGIQQNVALILISLFYFLFAVIFYTMNSVSFNAMLPLISEDPYDQSNVCTINSIFTSIGSLARAVAIPVLNALCGKNLQSSWTYLTIMLIVIALVGQGLCFFKVKEKKEIQPLERENLSKADLKIGMKELFKTKYFYIAVGMFAINYYISLSVSNVGVYYSEYVLDNDWYSSLFAGLPMITMGLGLLLTPFLVKKIGKKKTLSSAIICVFLGDLLGAIFPYSLPIGLTGSMIKGLGSAVVMSQLFTLAPDIVRYIELKAGVRVEGLAASANSFGSKIGSGLGAAVVLWTLSLTGYSSEEGATQPQSAITSFIVLYWWIPTILAAVLFILSTFWDINKKSEALEAKKAAENQ